MNKNTNKKNFQKFDREQFADWLRRGLQAFYKFPPSDRAMAFEFVGLHIVQQLSVSAGLAFVYENFVPRANQLKFRQAIGDVMRKFANDATVPKAAFSDLIYLIMRIRASESLNALFPVVGNGLIGKKYPDVLYEAITALRSLAPDTAAYDTARNLINSTNFDDGYLFEATKVLVECEPSQTSKVVLDFEPRLSELHQRTHRLGCNEWSEFCEAADDWACDILKLKPISALQELWVKADFSARQSWLLDVLFFNKSIPVDLRYDESSDKYFMKCLGKIVQVDVSDKDCWTRMKLLRESTFRELQSQLNDAAGMVNGDDGIDGTVDEEYENIINGLTKNVVPLISQRGPGGSSDYQSLRC